jgi:hypothetical protein
MLRMMRSQPGFLHQLIEDSQGIINGITLEVLEQHQQRGKPAIAAVLLECARPNTQTNRSMGARRFSATSSRLTRLMPMARNSSTRFKASSSVVAVD